MAAFHCLQGCVLAGVNFCRIVRFMQYLLCFHFWFLKKQNLILDDFFSNFWTVDQFDHAWVQSGFLTSCGRGLGSSVEHPQSWGKTEAESIFQEIRLHKSTVYRMTRLSWEDRKYLVAKWGLQMTSCFSNSLAFIGVLGLIWNILNSLKHIRRWNSK